MQIGGFVPFSTTDWPGQISAVLFCQGCPWRCLYCHNRHLQPFICEGNQLWGAVTGLLEKRRGLLDAVVFSGGEPTMQPQLELCMQEAKEMGLLVGLHTAGINPSALKKVLALADWVALDIKALPDDYNSVTETPESGLAPFECLSLIISAGIPYEVRTTVHTAYLTEERQLRLVELLAHSGVRNYALQPYRSNGSACGLSEEPLSEHVVSRCFELFETFTPR